MEDKDEQIIKLEKEYKNEIEAQKRYYESELKLLKSKYEYEKDKLKIENENKVQAAKSELRAYYNVKNTEDAEKLKQYYEAQLESQKDWYEQEIINRRHQTEQWHVKHFEEETAKLKQGYEEMLKAQEDKFKVQEEAMSLYIAEQKKIYEEQLKPFKRIINFNKKIAKKLHLKKRQKKEEKPEEILNTETLTTDIQRPKVSVILPVYNVGKYLSQALDSLINQTLKEIEIICVDDGSTDNCYEILEEYKQKDSRIKVIHKENKGTGAARNDGLRLATGECIGFVDPDDWVKPNMFERLYNLIKEKNLDIAMCMPDGYDEKNAVNAPFPYFVDANFENIPDDKIFNWRDLSPFSYPMCVWNKLYTKELFDKNHIEFAEGLDFEDHKVIFGSLLTAERIFFIREKLYVYRFNREGSILSDNNKRLIDHIEIFNTVENLMKETNTYGILRYDFLTYKIHNLLYYYSMIKDEYKSEYRENMIKSIKETNITQEEMQMLTEKYPDLKSYI